MAVAQWWDQDWGRHHGKGYEALQGSRGFDDMDEHILQNILGYSLDSEEAGISAAIIRNLFIKCHL